MDLFHIDRYMGDDQEAESEHDETSKFTRLRLEIEDRKRKRKSAQCKSSVLVKLSNSETAEDVNGKRPNKDEPHVEEKKAKNTMSSTETKKKSTGRLSESTLQKKARCDKDVKLCNEQSNCVMDGKDQSGKRKEKKKNKREKDDTKLQKDSEHEKDVEEEEILKKNASKKTKATGFTVIGGQNKNKLEKRVHRVLPDWLAKPTIINTDLSISLVPVEEMSCLGPYLVSTLQCHNIDHLFPVQSVVIPAVLSQIDANTCFGKGGYQPSDICVSAPTGSGKTLAYVLPIVKSLLRRVVCHLRALILLPTKDLASQVKQVFEMFTTGTNLRVGLASGSKSVSKDEEQLTDLSSFGSTSRVDILVCTPGRLVDHISSTPHFTLQHVRFLVIDEADRLLGQSYHGWLAKVLRAAYNSHFFTTDSIGNIRPVSCDLQTFRSTPGPQTATSFSTIQLPLQKLLFSATLTLSPEKLAPLQLFQPVLFTAAGTVTESKSNQATTADAVSVGRYTIPEGLSEYMTVCNNGEKPLVVLYYLIQLNFQGVLCFSSSLEATHRLYLLVKLYGGVEVAEYSSSLTPPQRKGILRDFRLGKLQLLICSDAMARGIDIQRVQYVISYDVPNYVKSYVHRVGRTARAGNEGTAITLLHRDEVHHFKQLIYKTGREKIPKYNIKENKLQAMVDKYQETLVRLQEAVQMEHQKKRLRKPGTENVVKVLQEQLASNLLQKSV